MGLGGVWKSCIKQNKGEISPSLGARKAGIITTEVMYRAYETKKHHKQSNLRIFYRV